MNGYGFPDAAVHFILYTYFPSFIFILHAVRRCTTDSYDCSRTRRAAAMQLLQSDLHIQVAQPPGPGAVGRGAARTVQRLLNGLHRTIII